MKDVNVLTDEEQAFIDGVEFARDYQIPISPEEHKRYEELIEKRARSLN